MVESDNHCHFTCDPLFIARHITIATTSNKEYCTVVMHTNEHGRGNCHSHRHTDGE